MAEMTSEQVRKLDTAAIIKQLRYAAALNRSNRSITWEHGTDLVNIVAIHGDALADALEFQNAELRNVYGS